jgi:hypothetical protein
MALYGYFQSKKYFMFHVQELKEQWFQFNLSSQAKILNIMDQNKLLGKTIAIQVRRGDYLNLSEYHTVLDINYYRAALEALNYSSEPYTIVCFSDDIEWCKNTLAQAIPIHYFSEGNTPIENMFFTSRCYHKIMANSSFSWWSAMLSANDGKVVAPKNWFGPKHAEHDTKDLYCEGWLLV